MAAAACLSLAAVEALADDVGHALSDPIAKRVELAPVAEAPPVFAIAADEVEASDIITIHEHKTGDLCRFGTGLAFGLVDNRLPAAPKEVAASHSSAAGGGHGKSIGAPFTLSRHEVPGPVNIA